MSKGKAMAVPGTRISSTTSSLQTQAEMMDRDSGNKSPHSGKTQQAGFILFTLL